MAISFDVVIFPGVPSLGDVHLKNVWSFSKGLYQENDKLWADRVEPLLELQGININLVVFKKTHGSPS